MYHSDPPFHSYTLFHPATPGRIFHTLPRNVPTRPVECWMEEHSTVSTPPCSALVPPNIKLSSTLPHPYCTLQADSQLRTVGCCNLQRVEKATCMDQIRKLLSGCSKNVSSGTSWKSLQAEWCLVWPFTSLSDKRPFVIEFSRENSATAFISFKRQVLGRLVD